MSHDRRLLLIAMSGVRIHDADLVRLGLTLPGFVDRGRVIASLPSLSLLTLAAWTPPDWEVEYAEIDDLDDARLGEVARTGYDLVGISFLTARARDAYLVADRLREAGTRVVLGGLHASALPHEAARHADAVVRGEGEAVWRDVVADAGGNRLRPVYDALDLRPPLRLDDGPLPRFDLLDPERYDRITIQSTRGCPLDCSFCGASRTISPFKRKSVARVRREIEAILAVHTAPFIELADDNTFVDKAWSKDLARLFREYGLRWFTETDVSVADDPELLDLLAESGCAQILVGLESLDEGVLYGVDRRRWKSRAVPSHLERIRRIQSHGVAVNGCFVFGLDGQRLEVFESVRSFVEDSGLCEVQITILTPFPGTRLREELAAAGRLLEPADWDRCTLFDVTFRPAGMTVDELRFGFRSLMRDLYGAEAAARRRARLRACRRGRPETTGPLVRPERSS